MIGPRSLVFLVRNIRFKHKVMPCAPLLYRRELHIIPVVITQELIISCRRRHLHKLVIQPYRPAEILLIRKIFLPVLEGECDKPYLVGILPPYLRSRCVDLLTGLYGIVGNEGQMKDLVGKTVYSTGQGTTPEYALRFLLEQYDVKDCTIEFKSEATEIASLLKEDATKIAVLPQPFATVAQAQNEAVKRAFTLYDAWSELNVDSQLVTGLTIVRSEFLEQHPAAVKTFMQDAAKSVEAAKNDTEKTAELIAEYGIIEKAPIAKKALPECNLVSTSGEEMKKTVSGYLKTLFDQDPKSVGGALPAEDFYYLGE